MISYKGNVSQKEFNEELAKRTPTFVHCTFYGLEISLQFQSVEFLECMFIQCQFLNWGFEAFQCDFDRCSFSNVVVQGSHLRITTCLFGQGSRVNAYAASICDCTGIKPRMSCPDTGAFIGWKKCKFNDKKYIVKLLIYNDSKRVSNGTFKCRTDKAKVIGIETLDGLDACLGEVYSIHNPNFVYKLNKTIKVPDFDENPFHECSTGIHFFCDRNEAVNY